MNLPTLYKKTSTGATQFWKIDVFEHPDNSQVYDIVTEYGQVGTDSPQITNDSIVEGKNTGKANETSPLEQAEAEAKAKWVKQKERKGYVESLDRAEAGENDQEGGISPMLAHKYSDHGHKIKYPAAVSRKLDGFRCVAVIKDGKCTLWSRQRKSVNSVPHIVKALEERFGSGGIILDGELFVSDIKFEEIASLVRSKNPKAGHEVVEYHIFDYVGTANFSQRYDILSAFKLKKPLLLVENEIVNNEDEMMELFHQYVDEGFEGLMIRNLNSLYVNKRSYDLLKVKEMVDDEFDIVGVKSGRGKMQDLAIFECQTKEGKRFDVKMKGKLEDLAKYLHDEKLWRGKKLTVQYQNLSADMVPRFGVGLRVYQEI